jgi:hypothetical protein
METRAFNKVKKVAPVQCDNDSWMVANSYRAPYLAKNRVYMQKGTLSEVQLDSLFKINVQVKTEREAVRILKRIQKLEGVWLANTMN